MIWWMKCKWSLHTCTNYTRGQIPMIHNNFIVPRLPSQSSHTCSSVHLFFTAIYMIYYNNATGLFLYPILLIKVVMCCFRTTENERYKNISFLCIAWALGSLVNRSGYMVFKLDLNLERVECFMIPKPTNPSSSDYFAFIK